MVAMTDLSKNLFSTSFKLYIFYSYLPQSFLGTFSVEQYHFDRCWTGVFVSSIAVLTSLPISMSDNSRATGSVGDAV